MVTSENSKRSTLRRFGILACAIGHAKKVAVSESREIAPVAYLGQITNIGSGRVGKLCKKRSREGRDISVREVTWVAYFRRNNKYWKKSRAKIIKGAL